MKSIINLLLKILVLITARSKFLIAGYFYRIIYRQGTLKLLFSQAGNLKDLFSTNSNIALFVVWNPKSFIFYERYLAFLKKLNFKPIIIINGGGASSEFMNLFKAHSLAIYERSNFGRDFGAYKEFIQLLKKENICPDRLLMCNDSIYADLQPNDTRFVDFIKNNEHENFVGAAEWMGLPAYHVQSYFIIISKKSIQSKYFMKFWNDFLITDDRRLNIHNGEIKLTQAIVKDGFIPKLFLSTKDFFKLLDDDNINNNLTTIIYDLSQNINARNSIATLEDLYNDYLKKNVTNNIFEKNKLFVYLSKIINQQGMSSMPISLIDIYGFPFIKRDIIYRQSAEWMILSSRFSTFDSLLFNDYLGDQWLRKRAWHLNKFTDRLMYEYGVI